MSGLRGEEQWAVSMIEAALDGVTVRQHDDGSQPGMYDLTIAYEDGRRAAVEVTAAADAASLELWNLVNGGPGRWIEPSIRGGWMATLEPTARAKRLRAELPGLLGRLEDADIREVRLSLRRNETDSFAAELRDLGIVGVHQSGTEFPGSIYLTIELPIERSGGFVDETGAAVPRWIAAFLAEDGQADVLGKLHRSGVEERHAFVLLPGFTPAPFGVVDMLMREDDKVPADPPSLPPEVTHIWMVSRWSHGRGLRWSPDGGWQRFDKQS